MGPRRKWRVFLPHIIMTQPGISPAVNIFALLMQIASCSVHAAAGTHFLSAAPGELLFSSVSQRQNCKCALFLRRPMYLHRCVRAWRCTRRPGRGLSCMQPLLAASERARASNKEQCRTSISFIWNYASSASCSIHESAKYFMSSSFRYLFESSWGCCEFKWELAPCGTGPVSDWASEQTSECVSVHRQILHR